MTDVILYFWTNILLIIIMFIALVKVVTHNYFYKTKKRIISANYLISFVLIIIFLLSITLSILIGEILRL